MRLSIDTGTGFRSWPIQDIVGVSKVYRKPVTSCDSEPLNDANQQRRAEFVFMRSNGNDDTTYVLSNETISLAPRWD